MAVYSDFRRSALPDARLENRRFLEKPADPVGLPDSPGEVLASMGNYVFDADALVEAVARDATEIGSKHDMGGDIVPSFVRRQQAGVYDYKDNDVAGSTDDRDGDLDRGDRLRIEAHLDECADCRKRRSALARSTALLSAAAIEMPVEPHAPSLWRGVDARIEASKASRPAIGVPLEQASPFSTS